MAQDNRFLFSLKERNRKIIEEYVRLVAQERESDPVRAEFISTRYYIRRIYLDGAFGLSEDYIAKLVNRNISV